MTQPSPGSNEEQIRHWNEVAGPIWVERQDLLDRMIGAFGTDAVDAARLEPGQRVVDVGCGTGQTTVEIARRVAPGGRVVGVDVSRPMLEAARARAARERAASAGVAPIELIEGDAQVMRFEPGSFDVVFSRFGVMFFADPVAAFANLRAALAPGGRLTFVCWQGLARNPWVAGPLQALAGVLPMPAPPPPGTPGPFSLAEPGRVEDILARAGFTDVVLEELSGALTVGDGSVEATLDFLMRVGPCATLLRDADRETIEKATSTLRAFFQSVARDGVLRMQGTAWLVRARR
jgi:SAM-dependent methyltransferase